MALTASALPILKGCELSSRLYEQRVLLAFASDAKSADGRPFMGSRPYGLHRRRLSFLSGFWLNEVGFFLKETKHSADLRPPEAMG
jgi:hypothetical protein